MKTFRVAQKLLIFNDQHQVLVLKASTTRPETPEYFRGKCDFPGGGVEIDEPLEDGLHREIEEEIGNVKYQIGRPILTWDWNHKKQGDQLRTVCILYEAQYQKGDIQLSPEHDSYYWVNIKDLFDKKYSWHHTEIDAVKKVQKIYSSY